MKKFIEGNCMKWSQRHFKCPKFQQRMRKVSLRVCKSILKQFFTWTRFIFLWHCISYQLLIQFKRLSFQGRGLKKPPNVDVNLQTNLIIHKMTFTYITCVPRKGLFKWSNCWLLSFWSVRSFVINHIVIILWWGVQILTE